MHKKFMQQAIELSIENVSNGYGGPFATLIIKNNTIIAQGVNSVTATHDPTAHAEIVAIRAACKKLQTHTLFGCEIYTTCEPCPMCLGAIYWAHLNAIFYANTQSDAAHIGFDDQRIYKEFSLNPSQRSIPTQQLMHEEALAAFDLWKKTRSKIHY
jgi:tRNA(Arg) A34 adenosine deaminase TadA